MREATGVTRIFGWFLFVFMAFLLVFGIIEYQNIRTWVTDSVALYGFFAIFFISLFLDLFPQYLSAHMLIVIAKLANLNLSIVLFVTLAGTLLASILGFWLGRRFEENVFKDIFGKKVYKKIDNGINKYGKWYVTISAVSPLPYIPVLFGALDMKCKAFIIYGIIPRLLGFIATAVFAQYALLFILKFTGF